MSRTLTYEKRTAPSGEEISVPVIPADASMQEIEEIVAEEGAAIMSEAQQSRFEQYIGEGVTRDGRIK